MVHTQHYPLLFLTVIQEAVSPGLDPGNLAHGRQKMPCLHDLYVKLWPIPHHF
jgi:hypothetical protein